ncbi:hypothetical protein NIES25_50490 [Nostoc linckia NIES-25]|nr:hypothetical protein NIES25_50490 [Nostoc linckia NIES-25]
MLRNIKFLCLRELNNRSVNLGIGHCLFINDYCTDVINRVSTNDYCTDAINRVSTNDYCTDVINRVSTNDYSSI